jgi:drug/metabolite transporter (DMT)-like permease
MFLHEQVPCTTWAAIALGFVGVAITSGIWTISLSAESTLALAAACLWAVGHLCCEHFGNSVLIR